LGFELVVGVAGLPIFQQSVDAEVYEWLMRELKRRGARSVQDVIRQLYSVLNLKEKSVFIGRKKKNKNLTDCCL
jgi:predicted CopG family antitoxin